MKIIMFCTGEDDDIRKFADNNGLSFLEVFWKYAYDITRVELKDENGGYTMTAYANIREPGFDYHVRLDEEKDVLTGLLEPYGIHIEGIRLEDEKETP